MARSDEGSIEPDGTFPTILVSSSVIVSLATITVVGRFLSKTIKRAPLTIDDALIVAAMIFTWLIYILFLICRGYGLGKHRDQVGEYGTMRVLKFFYFLQMAYFVAPPTIKLSLLLMYKRIFVSAKFTRFTDIMMGAILVWMSVELIMAIFNCTPISAFWTGKGGCLSLRDFSIGYAAVNIVGDLVVWAMPIPRVLKLELPVTQKVALVVIFSLGLVSCGAALARLMSAVLSLDSHDVSWDYAPCFLWSVLEPSVGIMCTCLPTMRALLNAMFRGVFRGMCSDGGDDDEFGTLCKPPWPRLGSRKYVLSDLDGHALTKCDAMGRVHAAVQGPVNRGAKADNDSSHDLPKQAIRVRKEIIVETGDRDVEMELSVFRHSHSSEKSNRP